MAATVETAPMQQPPSFTRTTSAQSEHFSQPTMSASFSGNPPHMLYTSSAPPANMLMHPGTYRSFGAMDTAQHVPHDPRQPMIYTAVYSGVSVYEMEINGIAVMRRRADSWLNATQILKVAGVDKGKRTKILEKEILTGEHEKVQGGYGKYQGTWISYKRGKEFCRQYGVDRTLSPLLNYDMGADGAPNPTGPGLDTPTKEQAMAANRKRLYNGSIDNRANAQASNGTFFQNISPTASNALAAMNKAARINSPAPRPGSAQKRPHSQLRRQSTQPGLSQENSFIGGSQQSQASQISDATPIPPDSTYGTQQTSNVRSSDEPPRKRLRPSSQDGNTNGDVIMREGTPTEANESFLYREHIAQSRPVDENEGLVSLPALPPPSSKADEEKQAMLMDLFTDGSITDYSKHPALVHLSGADLDLPLDQSANTALHWAATLARVPLVRLLISKGANMFRGTSVGQTPLMSAVQVNNCLDHGCFPEMLEILGPLIEVRDQQGRTILHHISVSCGIKGRAASSKYYLEALLEFLVRNSHASNAAHTYDGAHHGKPISLMRFMSEMVNARDKGGNTALNLVARIGNRNIIHQLLEVQADPSIPNYKGIRPIDFGVGGDAEAAQQIASPSKAPTTVSKIQENSRDIMSSISALLSQTESQFAQESRIRQDQIDQANASIRDLSRQVATDTLTFERLQARVRARADRQQRLGNLRRAVETLASKNAEKGQTPPAKGASTVPLGDADQTQQFSPASISLKTLKARIAAYEKNNALLKEDSAKLKASNISLESQYRKVVSLCTGVPEDQVETMIPQLVAAVESETTEGIEVQRVREFLRKVGQV